VQHLSFQRFQSISEPFTTQASHRSGQDVDKPIGRHGWKSKISVASGDRRDTRSSSSPGHAQCAQRCIGALVLASVGGRRHGWGHPRACWELRAQLWMQICLPCQHPWRRLLQTGETTAVSGAAGDGRKLDHAGPGISCAAQEPGRFPPARACHASVMNPPDERPLRYIDGGDHAARLSARRLPSRADRARMTLLLVALRNIWGTITSSQHSARRC